MHRNSRGVRYIGYVAWLGMLFALMQTDRLPEQLVAAFVFGLLWPPCADLLHRLWFCTNPRVLMVHWIEALGTGFFLAYASMPPLLHVLVLSALLCGNVAQGGWRQLLLAGAYCYLGFAIGALLCPLWSLQTTWPADVLGVLLLAGFAVVLSAVGYRKTVHLFAARQILQRKSQQLELISDRLSRYLPPTVHKRIKRAPTQKLVLQRRWLTVGFIDWVGFTALAEKLAAEELAEVLDQYLQGVTSVVDQHGGTLGKVLGDGVLIFFGDQDHTDQTSNRTHHARQCVALCKEIPALLAELSARWRCWGYVVNLSVRAGVASGYCTVGDWGERRLDYTVIGSAVNLAARLQTSAASNGVTICASTHALVAQQYRCEQAQARHFKGLGTVQAYSVVTESVDPDHTSAKVSSP